MTSAVPTPCPHCQQVFQPKRRNQAFCSSQCRIDANNDKTKAKYATYREEGPKAINVQKQLDEMRAFLLEQLLVAQGIEDIDGDTIKWRDMIYTRTKRADDLALELNITMHRQGGVYIVATRQLIYRRDVSSTYGYPYLYDLKQ